MPTILYAIWRYDERQPDPGRPLYRVTYLGIGSPLVARPVFSPDMLIEANPAVRLPGEPEKGPVMMWRSAAQQPQPGDLWAEVVH